MSTYDRYRRDSLTLERLTETLIRANNEADRGATYLMTVHANGLTYRVETRNGSTPTVTVRA